LQRRAAESRRAERLCRPRSYLNRNAKPFTGGAAAAEQKQNEKAAPAVAAQMRINGLNGNNPTPILSFSLGATNSASTAGADVGKATFSDLVVSKLLDGDSVPLLQAAATGQVFRSLVIEVSTVDSSVPFATYTFEDVAVTSNVLGSSNSSVNEQDAFDFRRITSDVTLNGQTFHSCFDIKALSSCS
jgi:type VI protein secretion system component Hcp